MHGSDGKRWRPVRASICVYRIPVHHKPPPGKWLPGKSFLLAGITVLKGYDECTPILDAKNGSQINLYGLGA